MTRSLQWVVISAAAIMLVGTLANGQAPSDRAPLAATKTINLSLEQRHIIKEIVLKDLNIKRETANIPLEVGAQVPPSVVTQPFPAEIASRVPQVKAHTFFVKDDRVVVVDPKDNVIADVIESN
jgi:hypothetical protein